jgi:hypothetical protein
MYYLLVDFIYKTIDFHGDNEREKQDHLLYFYNTFEECESKFENVREYLLDKYNAHGEAAYTAVGEHYVYLDTDDIDYIIDTVKVSEL